MLCLCVLSDASKRSSHGTEVVRMAVGGHVSHGELLYE